MQNLINTYLTLMTASQQLKGTAEMLSLHSLSSSSASRGARSGPLVVKDVWLRYS